MAIFLIPGVKNITPQQLPLGCCFFPAASRVIDNALFTTEKIAMIPKCMMLPQKTLNN